MYTIYYTCINVARGAHYLPHRGDNRTRRRQTSPHLARPAKFNVEYHELARGDTSFSQKMAATAARQHTVRLPKQWQPMAV
jgi:hypothetical protein